MAVVGIATIIFFVLTVVLAIRAEIKMRKTPAFQGSNFWIPDFITPIPAVISGIVTVVLGFVWLVTWLV